VPVSIAADRPQYRSEPAGSNVGVVPDDDASIDASVDARIAATIAEQEGLHLPVSDVERAPIAGDPPVVGAQWDEVHERWEVWDQGSGSWVVVGDDAGTGIDPGKENPLPASLARDLFVADQIEAAEPPPVDDVDRAPAPTAPVPGAQWNEVAGRWERWDEASGAWMAVEG